MAPPGARNTARHREAGAASRAETRRRLLESAAREFVAVGYAAATVSRIAAGAGVTVQTLYLAWGSKRELLRAYMRASLAADPDVPYEERRPAMVAEAIAAGETDAGAAVKGMARLIRVGAERASVGWQLYRDGAATDPAIAEDWQRLQMLRRGTIELLFQRFPPGLLRPDLTIAGAVDTAWAIGSPETYELLVRRAGYTLDEWESWVADTLALALLPPDRPAR